MSNDGKLFAWNEDTSTWVPVQVDATGRLILDEALFQNFRNEQKPAISIMTVGTLSPIQRTNLALFIEANRFTTLVTENPALSIVTRASGTPTKPAQTPALEIVRAQYDLLRTNGSNDMAEVGPAGQWANPSNAQGDPDGAPYATLSEGAALVTGTLRGNYPDSVNKDELTVTKVELIFYYRITDAAAGTILTLQARHGDGGVPVQIAQDSNQNQDFLVAGRTLDITATLFAPAAGQPALSWASVDDLQSLCDGSIAVSATTTPLFEVDAVRLRVTASRTDVL